MPLIHVRIVRAALLAVLAAAGLAGEPDGGAGVIAIRHWGAVEVRTGRGAAGEAVIIYRLASPALAQELASKRLADIEALRPDLVATVHGARATTCAVAGLGTITLGMRGAEVIERIARAPAEAGGADLFAATVPVARGRHPRWMDSLDNASFSFYFTAGGAVPKDIDADAAWLARQGFAMSTASGDEERAVAPGVLDRSIFDYYAALARRHALPYKSLLSWAHPMRPRYVWDLVPLPHVRAADDGIASVTPYYLRLASFSGMEPIPASDPYLAEARRLIARQQGGDPYLLAHHGAAEVSRANILELAGVAGSPHIQARWREWLAHVRGLDLAAVGRRHRGDATAFRTWDEVPVPSMADLVGVREAGAVDLRGTWEARIAADPAAVAQEGAWTPWDAGDPRLLHQLFAAEKTGEEAGQRRLLLRRSVTLSAGQVAATPFLHLARAGWHGRTSLAVEAVVNGRPAPALTGDTPGHEDLDLCFDLAGLLQAGVNRIQLTCRGANLPSYAALTARGRWQYPSADPALNAQWFDATEFDAWIRLAYIEANLRATRAGEPHAPMKVMAPWQFVGETLDLCRRYGAYIHDTGMGGVTWCPWLPHYAHGRGAPTSSEPGLPPRDAADFARMTTNYLMMGDDAVDIVFHPETVHGDPALAAWVEANREKLRAVGKYAPLPASLALLRSTRMVRLGLQEPFNWDLARSELQTVGRASVDIDLGDVVAGRVPEGIRVLFDAGTGVLAPDEVAAIAGWVAAGGTFVATHLTGMHTPEQAGAWPITALTGARVLGPAGGTGAVAIAFAPGLADLPGFSGRRLAGRGSAIDWKGNDRTGADLRLAVAADGTRALATWEDGSAAVTLRRLGAGRVLTLGSTFWRQARDRDGRYLASPAARVLLDRLLDDLGVARGAAALDAADEAVFVERRLAKNGLFDAVFAARMNTNQRRPAAAYDLALPGLAAAAMVEVGAAATGAVTVRRTEDGGVLPGIVLAPMQARIFIAPRERLETAGRDWLRALARMYHPIDAVPADQAPPAPLADVLPLDEGWRVRTAGAAWGAAPAGLDHEAAPVQRLGSYPAMGIDDPAAIVQAWRTFTVPPAWAGRTVRLRFSCQRLFWGVFPRGRLWLDGRLLPLPAIAAPARDGGFHLVLDGLVPGGSHLLAIEIDGRSTAPIGKRSRPSGVTGLLYLEAQDPMQEVAGLGRERVAILADGRRQPLAAGEALPSGCVLVEAVFTPEAGLVAAGRPVYLSWSAPPSRLYIDGAVIEPPPWRDRLDIRGFLRPDRPCRISQPATALGGGAAGALSISR